MTAAGARGRAVRRPLVATLLPQRRCLRAAAPDSPLASIGLFVRYDRVNESDGFHARERKGVRAVEEQVGFAEACEEALSCGLRLVPTDAGLSLEADGMRLTPDFRDMVPRLRRDLLGRELLVKAAKVKGVQGRAPVAVDATAGLGQDALLLAAAGFEVLLFERNPVIAALLQEALHRARAVPELAAAVARMTFAGRDSIEGLRALCAPPDAVYLDPMFPARQKSAAVKKKFQLLHRLERPCDDAEELLRAALDAHPRKVVVKRPPKGPHLAGVKPSYSIAGKAVRYDVIALAPSA